MRVDQAAEAPDFFIVELRGGAWEIHGINTVESLECQDEEFSWSGKVFK